MVRGATPGRCPMPSLNSDYPRYLAAKRSVDDRAINERVLRRLASELRERSRDRDRSRLHVLNLGAGIGGAAARLIERDVFPAGVGVTCTLVDVREANAAAARERLPEWARAAGYDVTDLADGSGGSAGDPGDPEFRVEAESRTIDVEVRVADAFQVVEEGEWDLLVGQAFLDLFDLDEALPDLLSALEPGGLCYFPITFDGGTVFEPATDVLAPTDLERAFHNHIDRSGGDSRAGRHLLTGLSREDASVLAAGSSDWVVHAHGEHEAEGSGNDGDARDIDGGTADGTDASDDGYPADEELFLRFIVDTVADALADDAESELTTKTLAEWRERRHEQLDIGELVYIAHQLDVLGCVGETSPELD
jgi:hypothetical protein